MPRPNPAQIAYGSATVVLSAVVLLLLTRTESGTGAVLIASGSLVLGLLVALTAPARQRATADAAGPHPSTTPAAVGRSHTEQRLPQPSLRR
ncbi:MULTISPECIES: hypothetical protein [unclassified Streptomyces]|uniref:hypothetical protein n=1 Tax=unclassified Streptomyces TaxID=2593676 RepID=UPI0022B6EAF6|nr:MULTISPECIES: hypothetical protein [unclassified Streptomyces]MCZ7414486.1 hypothetical protein [Streptomyces sp. WMMC897]MCZ7431442.1 hypothetical protein [Streptomyces sp. WMMC1477]